MSKPIYLFSISSHPDAISVNPLNIEFFPPDIDFSQYDYFIITSKQIAKILSFYEVKKESLKPALCISKQSAKSYKTIGAEVLDVAKGYGDTLVEYIQNYPKETKWLYLRAEVVASDFAQLCREEGYKIEEKILYRSSCSQKVGEVEIAKDAILLFTSPSSVECFLNYHTFTVEQQIVVIGKTTLKKIPKGFSVSLAKEQTIESCMQVAVAL